MTGVFCLAAVMLAATVPPPQPQVLKLTTATPVSDVALTDLNGDGRGDILAVCAEPETDALRRSVEVFLSTDSGAYPEKSSFTLKLETAAGTLFVAETDGAAPAELVVANGQGATVYAFQDGRFSERNQVNLSSLWPSRVKQPVFLTYAAHELNGDGIDEWLVPVSSGYVIRTGDGATTEVPCDLVSRVKDSYTISHKLPVPCVFQLDGQNQKSVALLSEEYADFAYGPQWSEHKRYKVPLTLQEKWEAMTEMQDIDGNGLPDLVVTQMQGKVNLKVLTEIYLAKEPFTFPSTPTSKFEVSGALTAPLLKDLNGDGKVDLLLLKVPLGVKLFMNYFVMQKLTVQAEVHLFNGGTFNPEPDFRNSITVDAPERRERPAYAMGDFNGDGRTDVVISASESSMGVYVGSEDRFISAKPWTTITMPSYGVARAYDLGGNEAEDIVLFHPDGENKQRIDVVVF